SALQRAVDPLDVAAAERRLRDALVLCAANWQASSGHGASQEARIVAAQRALAARDGELDGEADFPEPEPHPTHHTVLNPEPELTAGYRRQARQAIEILLSEIEAAASEIGGAEGERILRDARQDTAKGVLALRRLADALPGSERLVDGEVSL